MASPSRSATGHMAGEFQMHENRVKMNAPKLQEWDGGAEEEAKGSVGRDDHIFL